jgi:hypothetical protein
MSEEKFGIEIEALDTDQFLTVCETLTRCGIRASSKDGGLPTLWQSCHLLQKRGKYYITHFKELFILDGKGDVTNLDQSDIDRRNLIASNLENWGLVVIKDDFELPEHNISITIIPYKDKVNYKLKSKYSIGKVKGRNYE